MQSEPPTAKKLMTQYRLTLEAVSKRADCTMVEAYKALHVLHFSLCPLILVACVRRAVENELHEHGWDGQNENLWLEYDSSLNKLLQTTGKTHRVRPGHSISR